jgi:hypothetical protein
MVYKTQKVDLPDIRVFTSPGFESFKLAFRLAHPSTEEVELSKIGNTTSSIAVYGVKAWEELKKDPRYSVIFTVCDARQSRLHYFPRQL